MTAASAPLTLTRACMATTVPQGEWTLLPPGRELWIVQQLGGSITVRTARGLLLRIAADDADALGLEPPEPEGPAPAADDGRPFDLDRVYDALDGVYDPEIPVSIVQLGLVYRCEEVTVPPGVRRIEIDMTMTAPGCGMGDVLRADAEGAVLAVPGVDDVAVNLVWDPPWTMEHMSEAVRLQLGLL